MMSALTVVKQLVVVKYKVGKAEHITGTISLRVDNIQYWHHDNSITLNINSICKKTSTV